MTADRCTSGQLEYQSRNNKPNEAANRKATRYQRAEELIAIALVSCTFPRSTFKVADTAWAQHTSPHWFQVLLSLQKCTVKVAKTCGTCLHVQGHPELQQFTHAT